MTLSRISKIACLLISPLALTLAGGTYAQDQHPILDQVANASVAAGTANVTYQMGAAYGALPAGCISPKVSGGGTYYLCGNTWFSPSYGANGVIYRVVPTP